MQERQEEHVEINVVSTKDFIGIYDTNFNTSHLLNWYQHIDSVGMNTLRGRGEFFSEREEPERLKDEGFSTDYWFEIDKQLNPAYQLSFLHVHPYVSMFHNVIYKCIEMYTQEFRTASNYTLHHDCPNIQKTSPGGGYHIWHMEDAYGNSDRKLVTMMYLNDGFEGGETEWLYLSRREKPKTGRVIIFPAGFTHTHRGNPPLDGDKYIATSWVRDCSQPRIDLLKTER